MQYNSFFQTGKTGYSVLESQTEYRCFKYSFHNMEMEITT